MKTMSLSLAAAAALSLALGGCASTRPASPSLAVMPAKGKSYDSFQRDDELCQAAAQRQIGYESPGEAANQAAVSSAVVGTALGALAGAAIGSASANAGKGAAIGAGAGLLAGSAVGAGQARAAGGELQGRYDMAYAQCMRTRGHDIVAQAPPPPPQVVYVERQPTYVYPRPYYWGPGYRRPYYRW